MNKKIEKRLHTIFTKKEFKLLCDLHNETIFQLKGKNWRENLFCSTAISLLQAKYNVEAPNLVLKLEALSSVETLELLVLIDEVWGRTECVYRTLNIVSPRRKINIISEGPNKEKTLKWKPKTTKFKSFYKLCQASKMDYLIFSRDSTGYYKEVWGVTSEYLVDSLSLLSGKKQFSLIEKLSDLASKDL